MLNTFIRVVLLTAVLLPTSVKTVDAESTSTRGPWDSPASAEKYLLAKGVDSINANDFVHAARRGYADLLERLFHIHQPPDKSVFKHDLHRAMVAAIEGEHHACARILLANGADPDGGEMAARWANKTYLGLAIRQKDLVMVRTLIEAGADPHRPVEEAPPLKDRIGSAIFSLNPAELFPGFEPVGSFSMAILADAPEIVRYLYQRLSFIQSRMRGKYKKTATYYACEIKSPEMARTLHELGIPLDGSPLPDEKSPLYCALKQDNPVLVDYLLEETKVPVKGVNEVLLLIQRPDAAGLERLLSHQQRVKPSWFGKTRGVNTAFNAYGHPHDTTTPMDVALMQDDPEVVRVLLAFGAIPTVSYLDEAIRKEDLESVKLLVDHGADATQGLVRALGRGKREAAEFLLSLGARIDPQDKEIHKGLMGATWSGDTWAVKCLLEAGVPVDITEYDGTPLLHTALKNEDRLDNAEVVALLCEAGADPKVRFKEKGYLELAYKNNQARSARALTAAGTPADQLTPLQWAVLENDGQKTRRLLRAGGQSREARDAALGHAMVFGKKQIAAALLAAGADPNGRADDFRERHHLRTAVDNDDLETAAALLRHGADPNIIIGHLDDPIILYATKEEKPRAVALLAANGARILDGPKPAAILRGLLKHMPTALPETLKLTGIDPTAAADRAAELKDRLLEADEEALKILRISFFDTRNPQMAAFIQAVFAPDEIASHLSADLRHTCSGHAPPTADYLAALRALLPASGRLSFRDLTVSAPHLSSRTDILLDLDVDLAPDQAYELLEALIRKELKELALALYEREAAALDTEARTMLIKEATREHLFAVVRRIHANTHLAPAVLNALVITAATAGDLEQLNDLKGRGVDLAGPTTDFEGATLYTWLPYRDTRAGVVTAYMDLRDEDRRLTDIFALVPDPAPEDIQATYSAAIIHHRLDILAELYGAGFPPPSEHIRSLEKAGEKPAIYLKSDHQFESKDRWMPPFATLAYLEKFPGSLFLARLSQGGKDPLNSSEMLADLCKHGGSQVRDLIDRILAAGVEINQKDRHGRYPLSCAAANDAALVTFLLQRGADVNVNGAGYRPPIFEALDHNPKALYPLLRQADPPHEPVFLARAVDRCAVKGYRKALFLLMEAGAPLEMKIRPKEGGPALTPLCAAAQAGHGEIVALLLKDLTPSGDERRRALKLAVDNGHGDCVRELLAGVDPAKITIKGVPLKQYIRERDTAGDLGDLVP